VLIKGADFGFSDVLVALGTGAPVHTLGVPFLALRRIQVLPGDSTSAFRARVKLLDAGGAVWPIVMHEESTTAKLFVATLASEMMHMENLVYGLDVLTSNTGTALPADITTTATSSVTTTTTTTIRRGWRGGRVRWSRRGSRHVYTDPLLLIEIGVSRRRLFVAGDGNFNRGRTVGSIIVRATTIGVVGLGA